MRKERKASVRSRRQALLWQYVCERGTTYMEASKTPRKRERDRHRERERERGGGRRTSKRGFEGRCRHPFGNKFRLSALKRTEKTVRHSQKSFHTQTVSRHVRPRCALHTHTVSSKIFVVLMAKDYDVCVMSQGNPPVLLQHVCLLCGTFGRI